MKTNILRPTQQRSGGVYSLAKRVGFTSGASGSSDHASGSGATQTLVLAVLKPGDAVLPGTLAHIVTPYAHADTLTVSVGITGTVDRFLAATSVKSTTALVVGPTTATHALTYVNTSGSDVNLIATFTAGSGVVSGVTAGDLLINLPIVRRSDQVSA